MRESSSKADPRNFQHESCQESSSEMTFFFFVMQQISFLCLLIFNLLALIREGKHVVFLFFQTSGIKNLSASMQHTTSDKHLNFLQPIKTHNFPIPRSNSLLILNYVSGSEAMICMLSLLCSLLSNEKEVLEKNRDGVKFIIK